MRNAIQRLLKEHGEIALVAETASFQSNYCFEVSFGFAEDRTFF